MVISVLQSTALDENNFGGILTGIEIDERVKNGDIIIEPYCVDRLNPNSYNLRLGNKLKVYTKTDRGYIDSHGDNPIEEITIPEDGLILEPNKLYIGSTIERTATDKFIPNINGRSSGGRLGLNIHVCAGFGDIGFDGTWTLEIVVIEPLKVYPGDEIAQVSFTTAYGNTSYKYRGRYYKQVDPTESKFGETKNSMSYAHQALQAYQLQKAFYSAYQRYGSFFFSYNNYSFKAIDCSFELYEGEYIDERPEACPIGGVSIIRDHCGNAVGHVLNLDKDDKNLYIRNPKKEN